MKVSYDNKILCVYILLKQDVRYGRWVFQSGYSKRYYYYLFFLTLWMMQYKNLLKMYVPQFCTQTLSYIHQMVITFSMIFWNM